MPKEYIEGCEDCRRERRNQVKRLYGIWCMGENSWLRELPSKVDDGGIALLVLPTKKSACERAAKHYGYDSYQQAKKDGWCEVRAFTVERVAMKLTNIKIGFSPLSGELFIYRHGKDPQLALDKREAQADVMAAVVQYMMHDSPKGASQVVHFGPKHYEITVKPTQGDRNVK